MFIKQSSIDLIQNESLLDVVMAYVELKRSGSIYKGFSPFQAEKTPSFVVTPSKNLWKDFSSGLGGVGPISFVMQKEGLTFPDAVEKIAQILNVELKYEEQSVEQLSYSDAINDLQNLFTRTLNNKHKDYLYKRGVNDKSIHKWKIGAAPSYNEMVDFFHSSLHKEALLKLKLFGYNKERKEYYPKFYNRLMFPIFNHYNRIVGFSGRDLSGKSKSKYVNSNESEYFHKGKILYGLNFTNTKKKKIMLVEGQLDVILCHQHGLDIAVAAQGTGFTHYQFNLIKDYNILVCFDGDTAGINAAVRTTELMLKHGKVPKVTILPENKDVADILTDNNVNVLKNIIKKHYNGIDFYIKTLSNIKNIEKQTSALKTIKEKIIDFPNPIQEKIMDKYISITYGNDPVTRPKNSPISIEEATVIKYIIEHSLENKYNFLEECLNFKIDDKLYNKVSHGLDVEYSTFQNYVIELQNNCILKKIQQIKNNSKMNYYDKKVRIEELKKQITKE